ncbi:hypothetical protein [Gloeothece citriformis]|uniref:hypothetical protein n=1 Tax=Gloeothece citriformis TaxID=2546356 RepID=UPI0002D91478|nr:hypothetical protein [Gloeothece citriformis]
MARIYTVTRLEPSVLTYCFIDDTNSIVKILSCTYRKLATFPEAIASLFKGKTLA